MQGQTDVPLNEFGRKLARETRDGMRDIPFDFAITSPLERAKETAEIILEGRNVPIIEDDRIKEIGFGEYEGNYIRNGVCDRDPEFARFFNDPAAYVPPKGGESLQEVTARAGAFLEEIMGNENYQDSTILISAHGCVVSGMLNYLKQEPISRYWGDGVPNNCEVAIVDVSQGKAEIVREKVSYYKEKPVNMYR